MAIVQPELLSKAAIKPSTPTPNNLKTYEFSFLDYLTPHTYTRNIFFFKNELSDHDPPAISDLKDSLAKVLSKYYPFAGRIKDKSSIDCNDEGVEFFESRIACRLVDVLEEPDMEKMSRFLPLSDDSQSKDYDFKSLAVFQVTRFDCGGIAVGSWISGKVGDAESVASFLNDWAAVTVDRSKLLSVHPLFVGAEVLPTISLYTPSPAPEKTSFPTTRLVFEASKIDALKAEARKGGAKPVESQVSGEAVVAALIFKNMAAAMESSSSSKKCMMDYVVNLRGKTNPPLPENSIGNFFLHDFIIVSDEEMNLTGILEKLDACTAEIDVKYSKKDSANEWSTAMYKAFVKAFKMMVMDRREVLLFTSCCRLPLYDVDFGWGKPIWVGTTRIPGKNFVILLNTRRADEIEAWVSFRDEEAMDIFQHNEELLSFASLNPTIPLN
ncbi:hypothetical protein Nepgr_032935 [Nepenthes gracilis]|uniref:Uncharacterized protein n=1 Tax=Nepenthes gracilis TaxID=150966 RepID=A0AAD3Y665_NEPGR|nr:hypothetical protein Nepgr_032935 [Nepenthes gracilis]